MRKKIISLFLSFCLITSFANVHVMASEEVFFEEVQINGDEWVVNGYIPFHGVYYSFVGNSHSVYFKVRNVTALTVRVQAAVAAFDENGKMLNDYVVQVDTLVQPGLVNRDLATLMYPRWQTATVSNISVTHNGTMYPAPAILNLTKSNMNPPEISFPIPNENQAK